MEVKRTRGLLRCFDSVPDPRAANVSFPLPSLPAIADLVAREFDAVPRLAAKEPVTLADPAAGMRHAFPCKLAYSCEVGGYALHQGLYGSMALLMNERPRKVRT